MAINLSWDGKMGDYPPVTRIMASCGGGRGSLAKMDRYVEAIDAFFKAIELDLKDIIVWHSKVLTLTNLGRKRGAKEAEAAEKRTILEKEFQKLHA